MSVISAAPTVSVSFFFLGTAFRNRLIALDDDSHKLNFEVQTLKGQLDAEISKVSFLF